MAVFLPPQAGAVAALLHRQVDPEAGANQVPVAPGAVQRGALVSLSDRADHSLLAALRVVRYEFLLNPDDAEGDEVRAPPQEREEREAAEHKLVVHYEFAEADLPGLAITVGGYVPVAQADLAPEAGEHLFLQLQLSATSNASGDNAPQVRAQTARVVVAGQVGGRAVDTAAVVRSQMEALNEQLQAEMNNYVAQEGYPLAGQGWWRMPGSRPGDWLITLNFSAGAPVAAGAPAATQRRRARAQALLGERRAAAIPGLLVPISQVYRLSDSAWAPGPAAVAGGVADADVGGVARRVVARRRGLGANAPHAAAQANALAAIVLGEQALAQAAGLGRRPAGDEEEAEDGVEAPADESSSSDEERGAPADGDLAAAARDLGNLAARERREKRRRLYVREVRGDGHCAQIAILSHLAMERKGILNHQLQAQLAQLLRQAAVAVPSPEVLAEEFAANSRRVQVRSAQKEVNRLRRIAADRAHKQVAAAVRHARDFVSLTPVAMRVFREAHDARPQQADDPWLASWSAATLSRDEFRALCRWCNLSYALFDDDALRGRHSQVTDAIEVSLVGPREEPMTHDELHVAIVEQRLACFALSRDGTHVEHVLHPHHCFWREPFCWDCEAHHVVRDFQLASRVRSEFCERCDNLFTPRCLPTHKCRPPESCPTCGFRLNASHRCRAHFAEARDPSPFFFSAAERLRFGDDAIRACFRSRPSGADAERASATTRAAVREVIDDAWQELGRIMFACDLETVTLPDGAVRAVVFAARQVVSEPGHEARQGTFVGARCVREGLDWLEAEARRAAQDPRRAPKYKAWQAQQPEWQREAGEAREARELARWIAARRGAARHSGSEGEGGGSESGSGSEAGSESESEAGPGGAGGGGGAAEMELEAAPGSAAAAAAAAEPAGPVNAAEFQRARKRAMSAAEREARRILRRRGVPLPANGRLLAGGALQVDALTREEAEMLARYTVKPPAHIVALFHNGSGFDLPIISDTLFRRDTENGVTPVLKSDGPRIKQCVVNGVSYMDSMHHLPASLQANAVAFLGEAEKWATPFDLFNELHNTGLLYTEQPTPTWERWRDGCARVRYTEAEARRTWPGATTPRWVPIQWFAQYCQADCQVLARVLQVAGREMGRATGVAPFFNSVTLASFSAQANKQHPEFDGQCWQVRLSPWVMRLARGALFGGTCLRKALLCESPAGADGAALQSRYVSIFDVVSAYPSLSVGVAPGAREGAFRFPRGPLKVVLRYYGTGRRPNAQELALQAQAASGAPEALAAWQRYQAALARPLQRRNVDGERALWELLDPAQPERVGFLRVRVWAFSTYPFSRRRAHMGPIAIRAGARAGDHSGPVVYPVGVFDCTCSIASLRKYQAWGLCKVLQVHSGFYFPESVRSGAFPATAEALLAKVTNSGYPWDVQGAAAEARYVSELNARFAQAFGGRSPGLTRESIVRNPVEATSAKRIANMSWGTQCQKPHRQNFVVRADRVADVQSGPWRERFGESIVDIYAFTEQSVRELLDELEEEGVEAREDAVGEARLREFVVRRGIAKVSTLPSEDGQNSTAFALGTCVPDAARRNLMLAMTAAHLYGLPVLYCDTDSVAVRGSVEDMRSAFEAFRTRCGATELEVGNLPGCFMPELFCSRFAAFRPKGYSCADAEYAKRPGVVADRTVISGVQQERDRGDFSYAAVRRLVVGDDASLEAVSPVVFRAVAQRREEGEARNVGAGGAMASGLRAAEQRKAFVARRRAVCENSPFRPTGIWDEDAIQTADGGLLHMVWPVLVHCCGSPQGDTQVVRMISQSLASDGQVRLPRAQSFDEPLTPRQREVERLINAYETVWAREGRELGVWQSWRGEEGFQFDAAHPLGRHPGPDARVELRSVAAGGLGEE